MGLLSWLSGKPTEAQFAEQMLAALRAVGDSRELIYDSSQNSLVVKNGAECRINLTNIFHEHLKLPVTERKANVERLARTFADIPHQKVPDDYEEIKSRLLPKIWSRFAFTEFDLQQRLNGGKPLDIPLYPLGQHLYSSLVLDEEGAMRSVSNDDLKTWGITYYEAMEDAKRNLDEATKQYAQLGDTCYCFVTGDNYDSSRILGSLIHTLNVSGDLVAVVPNRDSAFVAGTEDDEALRVMFDVVEKVAAEEGRPLSPLPLVYRDGDWEDWIPPASPTTSRV